MSRFDQPDPSLDPEYCNGLAADDEDDDEEPRCAECGCGLHTETHAWDCSYGDDEEQEQDED